MELRLDKFQDKNLIPGLRGIIPSLHTPFNQDDSLDLVSLKKLVEHTIMTGCAGMLDTTIHNFLFFLKR